MSFRIIGGQFKGRILKVPRGLKTRPTQGMLRESVFNICQNIVQGARFLDLFAGSGAMGLEAISRGASHATFIESDRNAVVSIRENIAMLEIASQTTLIPIKVELALKRLSSSFDIIYIDPPYDTSLSHPIEELLARNLIAEGGILFLEERKSSHPASLSFPQLAFIGFRRFGEALLHQYQFYATTKS